MTITFNDIPSNLRIPGIFVEFDPSRANSGTFVQKLLVLGQRLNTGAVLHGDPMPATNIAQAESFWGRGAMITQMLNYIFKARPTMQVWGIGLDDLVAGVVATGQATFTGSASTSGTMIVDCGGELVKAGIASGDSQSVIASAVVAAITAQTDFPITAVVNGGATNQVDISARHKGEYANALPIKIYFDTTVQPTAPAIAVTQLSGGTGNPDVTDAITSMGDDWYNWIVMPWTDNTNLTALETELTSRYSPLRQIGARAFCALRGTYGQSQAFGDGRNSPHITCRGTGIAPQPPYLWAAVNAVVAANSLAIDPARQLQGLPLPNILPPEPADRFTFSERNLLLFDGISTHTVDAGGRVIIEAQITMYQETSQGLADDSLLYMNTPEIFERYRYALRIAFAPYARDKLADDGDKIPAGQPIMTPKKGRSICIQHYRSMVEELGWCEDLENYIATLLVEKQANRLAIVDQPNFIDNFRQLFMRSELVA